jgi:hypothetical protein
VVDFRIRRGALRDPHDAESVWWDVIERAFEELRTPYEPDPRLAMLTPGQRAQYALHWARSEIDNGGFHQYLFNSTGMLANDAFRGAELIGATEFAQVFRDVRSLFGGDTFVEDHVQRADLLEGLSDEALASLDQLTERFYSLMGYVRSSPDESTLARHCAEYVEAHPEEFFLPDPALETPTP